MQVKPLLWGEKTQERSLSAALIGVAARTGEAVTRRDARELNSVGLESRTSKNRFMTMLCDSRLIAQIIPFLLKVQLSFCLYVVTVRNA